MGLSPHLYCQEVVLPYTDDSQDYGSLSQEPCPNQGGALMNQFQIIHRTWSAVALTPLKTAQ